jgi:hypothetical protein
MKRTFDFKPELNTQEAMLRHIIETEGGCCHETLGCSGIADHWVKNQGLECPMKDYNFGTPLGCSIRNDMLFVAKERLDEIEKQKAKIAHIENL